MPVLGFLFSASEQFIFLIFANKWDGAGELIKVFVLVGIIQIVTSNVATYALYVMDRARTILMIDIIFFVSYLLMFLAVNIGHLMEACILFSAFMILKCLTIQTVACKELRISAYELVALFFPTALSFVAFNLIYLFSERIIGSFGWAQLIISCLLALTGYLTCQILLNRNAFVELCKAAVESVQPKDKLKEVAR